jgi:Bifunctional DNA primase/polymerase, N-terminal/Family of unknown function (DUF5906)/Primase C terminal 2 (PriCT-2)
VRSVGKWTEYLSYGWQLCELRPGSKAPRESGWQTKGAPFNENALGAGIVHQWSGTCALDVDDYEKAKDWLAGHGIDLDALFTDPNNVRIDSGRGNHAKLLFALPEALKSKKIIENKKNIFDFRCIGNQDVAPPSVHPDTGQPYRWGGADLLMGLPRLPAALEALWRAQLTPATSLPVEAPSQASEAQLAELLASQDPDCDYLQWIKVGMAVHAATNGQGFYTWDNWSRKGDKYNLPDPTTGLVGSAHLMSHWKSFRAAGGVGLATLLSEKKADVAEFPTEEASEFTGPEVDENSVAGRVHRLIQQRLVYISSMDKFYLLPGTPAIKHLDEHANCGLKPNSLDNIFQRFMPEVPVGDKGAFRRLKVLDSWRELSDPQIVESVGFHPGRGRVYRDELDGKQYLNRYKEVKVTPLAPKPHELEAWEFLISRVGDDAYRHWLLQFFAFILRKPGIKVAQAPLLYSEDQGTGKTTLMNVVPALLYGRQYVNQVTNEMLGKSFNSTMGESWFIVLDELKTNAGRQDRVALANKMKPWITDPMLAIERKGLDIVQVPNRLQITATSNYNDAVQIDDGDRRWAVCKMLGKQMTEAEIADLYDGFLNTPRAAGVLRYIFDRVDLTGFSPTARAPQTKWRAIMISTSLGPWERKIAEACVNGTRPFGMDIVTMETVQDLLVGTGANVRQIADILKKPPFNMTQLRTQTARMYCWRNKAEWAALGATEAQRYILGEGARPFPGSDLVPLAIRAAAGDDSDPDDVSDLLGETSA